MQHTDHRHRCGPEGQISPTGLTRDYGNEVVWWRQTVDIDGIEGLRDQIRRTPIPSYEERYPEREFPSLHTAKAKPTIAEVGRIVGQINTLGTLGTLTIEEAVKAYDRVMLLISGAEGAASWKISRELKTSEHIAAELIPELTKFLKAGREKTIGYGSEKGASLVVKLAEARTIPITTRDSTQNIRGEILGHFTTHASNLYDQLMGIEASLRPSYRQLRLTKNCAAHLCCSGAEILAEVAGDRRELSPVVEFRPIDQVIHALATPIAEFCRNETFITPQDLAVLKGVCQQSVDASLRLMRTTNFLGNYIAHLAFSRFVNHLLILHGALSVAEHCEKLPILEWATVKHSATELRETMGVLRRAIRHR